MKLASALSALLFVVPFSAAHADMASDQIRGMAGCYTVKYEFNETFVRQPNYPITSKPYAEGGLEYIALDFDGAGAIHLQHILATPMGPLKHWRQEWTKAPSDIWQFDGRTDFDNAASSVKWSHQGNVTDTESWVQRVTQVDDSPRYECAARWVDTGVQKFWECETPAPLPRREFSKRSDYDVLQRRNRHQLTSTGWALEEDNKKIQSKNNVLIAEEKGLHTYTKVDDSRCEELRNWWTANKLVWDLIRGEFDGLRAARSELRFKPSVGGEPLWQKLFVWADANAANSGLGLEKSLEVRDIIGQYLE